MRAEALEALGLNPDGEVCGGVWTYPDPVEPCLLDSGHKGWHMSLGATWI